MKPVIELEGYRIVEMNYKFFKNEDFMEYSDTDFFNPTFKFGLNEDFSKGQVIIEIDVNDEDNKRKLYIKLEGQFKINKDELDNDEEKIKNVLALNGTSILLPYARSIVSFMSTLDSSQAIIIPTINVFEALKK